MTEMKEQKKTQKLNAKRFCWIILAVLMIAAITVSAVLIFKHTEKRELHELQQQKMQELMDREGEYDAQSIILTHTTHKDAEALAEQMGAALRITKDGSFATLTLPQGVTIMDIYSSEAYLRALPQMVTDFEVRASELSSEEVSERQPMPSKVTPTDKYYSTQTYLDYLNLSTAWNKTKGKGITVAVIDTGIDTDHPEFSGRISEYSYNATEDKIVKDYSDWSLVEDEQGHGTAVTGVIAASMNNSQGIVGIAPEVTVIAIKAECDENGIFKRSSDLVFGLYYAIERDVSVVNMSFGTGINVFAQATQLAYDSDIICVAAAGNDATSALCYPAADEHVIGVGALAADSWDLAEYSNYGENVNMVAPGSTYTTLAGGTYGMMQGTSLSSPITTGAIALFMSQNKYATFDDVTEVLYASCYDLGALGCDWDYGYGALDVSALLLEERGTVTYEMLTDELENESGIFIRNHTLQSLPEPERLYAIFDGWYYDPQCTEPYNYYEDKFTTDLTLYAKWVNEDDGVPFTYVTLPDDTIEIRSYTGHRRFVTVPEKIDGKTVTSIGDFAFDGQRRIREINLPSGLTKIGRYAFRQCSNLTQIYIPEGVTTIGESAFADNVRLSTIVFEADSALTSIGSFAFENCGSLRKIELPASLNSIDGSAFVGTTSLSSIGVWAGNRSFVSLDGVLLNKTKSTIIAYPAGITGNYTVPSSVRSIGSYAFTYARCQSIDLNRTQSIGVSAFCGSMLRTLTIPDSVTSMGASAFSNNPYLNSLTLGSGLSEIPKTAFFGCSSLTAVEIPSNIRTIGASAFSYCSLQQLNFAENSQLRQIGNLAFVSNLLTSVTFPKSLIQIGKSAFAYNYFLSSVTFEEGSELRTIGSKAFAHTSSLTQIDFPETLSQIGEYAFMESGLTAVTLKQHLTSLGAGAFASCHSLTAIDVVAANTAYQSVNGVVYTKDGTTVVAYPAGNAATSYTVLSGTTAVGDAAFYGAAKLSSVTLPTGVQTIGNFAFAECTNVTSYSLPATLTDIGEYAFAANTNLPSISIPDNVIRIGRFAFYLDWKLTAVRFGTNSKLARIGLETFAYCGLTSFTVPANVSTIAQFAFLGCSNMTSATFAENSKLASISAYMFDGCDNLKTITFKSGSALTSIQAHGLEGMRKLTSIDFGDTKLTNIDNFAFRFCESLTEFNIPDGVTYLGRYAFYECAALTTVRVPASVEYIGRFAFLGAEKVNVYFAAETLPAYLAEDWDHGILGYYLGVTDVITEGDWTYAKLTSGGVAIIQYTGSATSIDLTKLDFGGEIVNVGGSAFAYSGVENIVLPESVVTIQANAFYHSAIKNVTIPENVEFIGKQAFADTPLASLSFATNAKVKVIEQSAFEGTTLLSSVTLPASLERMGRAVFKNSGLSSLSFADGSKLTEIPQDCFAYTKLTSVAIPASVTTINHGAFRGTRELANVSFGTTEELTVMSNAFYQSGLRALNIPANMTYIGEYAFVGLYRLESFTVDAENPYYKEVDGLLLTKDGRKLIAVPAGRTGSLTVPVCIEEIGFGAFEDSALSEILFDPNANILSFGYRAFYHANSITEITVPASVVAIDYYAFAECERLTTVTFAEGSRLAGVYEGAFYGDRALKNILLPDSIVEISDFAFYGCSSLTSLPVSETTSLKGIYRYAMAYTGVTELTLPETVIDLDEYAFRGAKLTSVVIPDAKQKELIIGIGAFADCNEIEEITLPFIGASFEDPEITWFGYLFGAGDYTANASYVPESLKKVTLSEGITFVGDHAFYQLAGLEEISVPHSVTTLHPYAFGETTAKYELTNTISGIIGGIVGHSFGKGITGSLVLAEGVTSIGSFAFYGCEKLMSITIPDSVTSIDRNAFSGCSSLTSITIPDSVTRIDNNAFSGCSSLTSITIGNGVTSIDGSVFSDCISLTSITIPDSVMRIDNYAFSGCSSLKSITIPNGVTSIDMYAFYRCSSLTSVTIGNSVTSIGYCAFDDCYRLYVIYNYSDLPLSIGSSNYGSVAECAKLIVDKNGNKTYKDEASGVEYIDTADGFLFMKENGAYKLIAYFGSESTVTLPANVNGYSYTVNNITGIQHAILSSNMTKIPDKFFYQCTNLLSIMIPNSVTSIGESAFYDCSSLTSITIPDSVTSIDNNAFSGCSSLTSITIPDSVTSIGASAFSSCSNLTSIIIPDGVTSIGSYEFYNCRSLTSVMIGNSVTSIGDSAFSSCSNLTSVTIGKGVQSIASNAFFNCPITSFQIDAENLNFSAVDGVIYNKAKTKIVFVPYGITELCIPATVTSISSLRGNTMIQSVTFEEGSQLTSIGDSAFRGCSSLTSVAIPDSVTSIGDSAFSYCSSLTSVTIGKKVQSIETNAFVDSPIKSFEIDAENPYFSAVNGVIYNKVKTQIVCVSDGVTELCIPATVKSISVNRNTNIQLVTFEAESQLTHISSQAFYYCSSLTSITIPDSVTSIGIFAFYGCSSLTSITIPDSVTSIGDSAFRDCSSLTSITIPDGVTSIGMSAFSGCSSLTSITIPDGVTSINFSGCSSLTSITIPDGVTSINFSDCSSLTSITIPDGVTSIGYIAFRGCSSLTSITIPNSVTSIDHSAFWGCNSLTSITIGNGVTSIGDYAFHACNSLHVIYNYSDLPLSIGSSDYGSVAEYAKLIVDKNGNKTYKDEASGVEYIDTADGFLFMKENGAYKLIAYLGNEETVTLPLSINGESYIIYAMSDVRNVILPEGMTSIGASAFSGCSSLTSITIPDSVTSIGNSAFSNCRSLTGITIPDGVTSIGDYAFRGCSSLTSITIPDSVTSIGDYAFWSCYSLTSVTIGNGVTSIGDFAFDSCRSLTSITIPDGVTSIGYYVFQNCSSLTSVTIGNSVTSIGDYAFRGCSSLTSITIGNGVTSIGYSAFENCSSLTSITIPDGVTNIRASMFADTAYYKDDSNWENGVLYLGNYLISVAENAEFVHIKEGIKSIASDAFNTAYHLKFLELGLSGSGMLSSLTNLETLKLTKIPTHYIYRYFGSSASSLPITFQSVVLGKDVVMNKTAFKDITGITIYVEGSEKDLRWDENYPGWNNGNTVIYGDDWIMTEFYAPDGSILSQEIFSTSAVIRYPHVEKEGNEQYSYVFEGWDLDGDGIADTIPATSTVDIIAKPIFRKVINTFTVTFYDKDGVTVLSQMQVPYGTSLTFPSDPTKKGHDFLDWEGADEGMSVTEDLAIYSKWQHHGTGHVYADPVWVDPTCEEQGFYKHSCTVCDEWYGTDFVPALGHSHEKSTVAPTCTERGYDLWLCHCGDSYRENYTDALGHDFGELIVDLAPTCTEQGAGHYACGACGYSEPTVLPAKGHDYSERVIRAASCSREGLIRYTCACGDVVDETIEKTNHDYQKKKASKWWFQWLIEHILNVFFGYEGSDPYYFECTHCGHIQTLAEQERYGAGSSAMSTCIHSLGEWVTVHEESNCEKSAAEGRICSICREIVEARIIAATEEHHFGDWYETKAPTCTATGTDERECTVCHAKDTRSTDSNGHSFTNYQSNNDATYTEDGTETAICDHCSETDTRTIEGSALGLDQQFKDKMAVLSENANTETIYAELYSMIEFYAALSEEEKANVAAEYAVLEQMIAEYNAKATTANAELADATELAFAPIAVTGFVFMAALWFLLKKKFLL